MSAPKPGPKAAIYAQQLDAARRAGEWHKAPGVAGAPPFDWPEMIRKFSKHNPHRPVTSEAARAEQAVHIALQQARDKAKFDDDKAYERDGGDDGTVTWPPTLSDDQVASDAYDRASGAAGDSSVSASYVESNSARLVAALALYARSDYSRALETLQACQYDPPARVETGSGWEPHDIGLLVMGRTLQGYCHERVGNDADAVAAYHRAIALHEQARRAGWLSSAHAQMDFYGEDAAYRGALLAARTKSREAVPLHRAYLTLAEERPASHRPTKRAVICRSLLVAQQANPQEAGADWLQALRSYESVLRSSSKFPKAGELDRPTLDLIDRARDAWETHGAMPELAPAVIDIMYNALERTFHSQRLLRHLVRLHLIAGHYEDAEAALDAYLPLYRRHAETVTKSGINGSKSSGAVDEGTDADGERDVVTTLLMGARLCSKFLDKRHKAVELADEAHKVLSAWSESASARDLQQQVARMQGITRATLAAHDAERTTRVELQQQALKHLEAAAAMDEPTFETLYHLAYLQGELRDPQAALATARKAIALDEERYEAWNLVALLTSATKDRKGAFEVCSLGLEEDTALEGQLTPASFATADEEGTGRPRTPAPPQINGSTLAPPLTNANAGITGSLVNSLQKLLGRTETPNGDVVQPASSKRRALDFPRDDAEDAVAELQLRITRNFLIEALSGPETALQDQQTLFADYAELAPRMRDPMPAKDQPPPLDAGHDAVGTAVAPQRAGSVLRRGGRQSVQGPPASINVPPRNASIIDDTTGRGASGGSSASTVPSKRAAAMLQRLWLVSAATFRRWGKYDECLGAIQEAERLDAANPDVWVQLGLHEMSARDDSVTAQTAFLKALSLAPDHRSAVVHMAHFHLERPETDGALEIAEGLLDTLTQGRGWDLPEAWWLFAKAYTRTERHERARDCLRYALDLEESKPIRDLSAALPRIL